MKSCLNFISDRETYFSADRTYIVLEIIKRHIAMLAWFLFDKLAPSHRPIILCTKIDPRRPQRSINTSSANTSSSRVLFLNPYL